MSSLQISSFQRNSISKPSPLCFQSYKNTSHRSESTDHAQENEHTFRELNSRQTRNL